MVQMKLEGSLQEPVFSFQLVGPGGQTQVIKLGSMYPLSHLVSPVFIVLTIFISTGQQIQSMVMALCPLLPWTRHCLRQSVSIL